MPDLFQQVAPGAWLIRLPLPWKRLETVNAYLFRGPKGYFLIDCGLNTDETFAAFDAVFAELKIDWRAIDTILISHMHPDHFGGAARARKLSGAAVLMHPKEAALVAPREQSEFFVDTATFLLRHGTPQDVVDRLRADASKVADKMDRFHPDGELNPGDTFEYAGGRIEAVWAPGHSPALLCFHDPERRILFSTDAVLERISPNIGVHSFYEGNPLGEYFDTLARLEKLAVELVVPSHGNPFEDLDEWIAGTRGHHRSRLEKMAEAAGPEPVAGWEIAGRVWGERLSHGHRRLALAEALSHLEFLARTGGASKSEVDGALLWKAL